MIETILEGLMFGGVTLFGLAFIFKPTDKWKWGQKHFWKLGILGGVMLVTGAIGALFLLAGKG